MAQLSDNRIVVSAAAVHLQKAVLFYLHLNLKLQLASFTTTIRRRVGSRIRVKKGGRQNNTNPLKSN